MSGYCLREFGRLGSLTLRFARIIHRRQVSFSVSLLLPVGLGMEGGGLEWGIGPDGLRD